MSRTAAKGGQSRAQAVHRALKRAILDQALLPGSKLPEDWIGERLGVSRTLVREALVRLSEEGLVEMRPNRGAVIARPSLEEGYDLFRTRLALERLVVETLSGKLTEAQVKELKDHIVEEERARAAADSSSIRLAGEFHTRLAALTGNATLIRFVNETTARSSLILALYGRPHSSECAVLEHGRLVEMLQAGDTEAAVAEMERHLDSITVRALLSREHRPDIQDVLSLYAAQEGLG